MEPAVATGRKRAQIEYAVQRHRLSLRPTSARTRKPRRARGFRVELAPQTLGGVREDTAPAEDKASRADRNQHESKDRSNADNGTPIEARRFRADEP
jgi:hypothetical protein